MEQQPAVFNQNEYVFVRDVSAETKRMNGNWQLAELIGKIGKRIKVKYTRTTYDGRKQVRAANLWWHENDLMTVEDHRQEQKLAQNDSCKKSLPSLL